MILISVKSTFMDVKHQEETGKGAEKWLRSNKKLHETYRKTYPDKDYHCKVEIINTDANQLSMVTLLQEARSSK